MQTLLGLAVFLKHIKYPHHIFRGSVVTYWEGDTGLSLGLFIFTGPRDASSQTEIRKREMLLVHEYGHFVQSLILGPLYLIIIGIPSVIWANIRFFERMRNRKGRSYYSFYTEKWASSLGMKITKEDTFTA